MRGLGQRPKQGLGQRPKQGLGRQPQKPSEENGVSEQAAKQPTIETGLICKG